MTTAWKFQISDVVAFCLKNVAEMPASLEHRLARRILDRLRAADNNVELNRQLRRRRILRSKPFEFGGTSFIASPKSSALRENVSENGGIAVRDICRSETARTVA